MRGSTRGTESVRREGKGIGAHTKEIREATRGWGSAIGRNSETTGSLENEVSVDEGSTVSDWADEVEMRKARRVSI